MLLHLLVDCCGIYSSGEVRDAQELEGADPLLAVTIDFAVHYYFEDCTSKGRRAISLTMTVLFVNFTMVLLGLSKLQSKVESLC